MFWQLGSTRVAANWIPRGNRSQPTAGRQPFRRRRQRCCRGTAASGPSCLARPPAPLLLACVPGCVPVMSWVLRRGSPLARSLRGVGCNLQPRLQRARPAAPMSAASSAAPASELRKLLDACEERLTGFRVPIEVRQAEFGRGIFVTEDVPEGAVIWSNTGVRCFTSREELAPLLVISLVPVLTPRTQQTKCPLFPRFCTESSGGVVMKYHHFNLIISFMW